MKSIKDLREDYNLITEKEEHDMNKLTQLVRAGLFDAKKLSALKRAMEKPADKMTAQEKRMMINLLDALMSEVLSDKQVYRKVKQDVMKEAKSWETKDYLAKDDPRIPRSFPTAGDIPSVVLLKRKGIRVFPDGHKIALYYAQAIDKYVSIPFNEIGISEEIELEEGKVWDFVKKVGRGIANTVSGGAESGGSSGGSKPERKYSTPKTPSLKATISSPTSDKKDDDSESPSVRSRMRQQYRKSLSENFKSKLETLKEFEAPKGVNPKDPAAIMKHFEKPAAKALKNVGKAAKLAGPVGAAVGLALDPIVNATPAGDEKEREWELNKSKREKPATAKQLEKQAKLPSAPKDPNTGVENKPDDKGKAETQNAERLKAKELPAAKSGSTTTTAEKPAAKQADTPKPKPDPATLAAAAKGLGIASALGGRGDSGSSDSERERKPLTPMNPKLKATLADPKYAGTDSAIKSVERKLFRKSLTTVKETTEVDLDGKLFEINTKAATKVKSLYESLNKKNKKKMVEMMNESADSLEKVVSFAVRQ